VRSRMINMALMVFLLLAAALSAGQEEMDRALVLLEKGERLQTPASLDAAEDILKKECDRPSSDSRCELYLARLELARYSFFTQAKRDPQKAEAALKRAEEHGARAVKARPRDPQAHVVMGKIHQLKLTRYPVSGLTKAALSESPVLSEYKKAIELDPENGEARMGLGIYYQFIPRVLGGDGHRARGHFKEAAGLMPGNPEPLVWISISYREEGRLDEAREYLERAKALDPANRFVLAEQARLRAAEKRAGR